MTQLVEFVVIGLPQSGKTTFIQTICPQTEWHNHEPGGWLFGLLPVDDYLNVQFTEPPQMVEFDFMWMREMISTIEVDGFIVIINSTIPQAFGESVYILQTIRAYHPDVPIVIAANCHDVPGAWDADDIRMGLGIPADMPVINCVAYRADQVKEPVLQLLYKVLGAAH